MELQGFNGCLKKLGQMRGKTYFVVVLSRYFLQIKCTKIHVFHEIK